MRLWDLRAPQQPNMSFTASTADVLAADWNKYHPGVLATSGKDGAVRVWDVRNPVRPTVELAGPGGHQLAVRKVQWSPHHADVLASAGYDMSTRIWKTTGMVVPFAVMGDHTEFCMALGWALFEEGVIATGGWDQVVNVYKAL